MTPLKTTFNKFLDAVLSPFRKLFMFLGRVIPGVKKLGSLNPEIITAVLVFLFLLLIYIFARLLPSGDEDATFATQLRGWPVALGLIVGIPIVLYFFLRVLLRPPASPYPDIDASWNAGLAELRKNGLDIKQIPICLVLGMSDGKRIRAFMEASNENFDVHGATGPGQSLIWYASKDQGYVFLSGVGNLVQFVGSTPELKSADVDEGDFTHTANIQDFYKVKQSYAAEEPESTSRAAMGTLRASDIPSGQLATAPVDDAPEPEVEPPRPTTVRAKSSEEKNRLRYLSQLIRKGREPVCPANGIMTNVSLSSLEAFPEELSRKLNDDLSVLTENLGVVCSVTAVVSGFERDEGFVDFAERLMEENGADFIHNKFGKSYRSWAAPSQDQLEKIAHASVEEFDHFTHLLFSKRDALSGNRVVGNRLMVKFLCRLYAKILPGLKVLLSRGHGTNPNNVDEFPRFAGCYFVGNDEQRNYFVRKVFERVEENQGEIEWTRKVLGREETWSLLTNLCILIGLLSLVAFTFLFFYEINPAK